MIFDFLKRKTEREKVRLFSEVSKITLEDEVHSLIASGGNLYAREGLYGIVTIRGGRIISRKDFVKHISLHAADANGVYLSYYSSTSNEIVKMKGESIMSILPIEGHVRQIRSYGKDLYASISKGAGYSIIKVMDGKPKWRFDIDEYINDFVPYGEMLLIVANRCHFITLKDGDIYSESKLNAPVEEMVFLEGKLYAISGIFYKDEQDISVITGNHVVPRIHFNDFINHLTTNGKNLYVSGPPNGSRVFAADGKKIISTAGLGSNVGSIAVDAKYLYVAVGKYIVAFDLK